eukprot:PLAT14553.1.p1 GENE.PLAT14553.1~~PLAT14553.1.p1  ORF type:complete len:427 (+),score=150.18 PLAT14553.1:5-1285(+)
MDHTVILPQLRALRHLRSVLLRNARDGLADFQLCILDGEGEELVRSGVQRSTVNPTFSGFELEDSDVRSFTLVFLRNGVEEERLRQVVKLAELTHLPVELSELRNLGPDSLLIELTDGLYGNTVLFVNLRSTGIISRKAVVEEGKKPFDVMHLVEAVPKLAELQASIRSHREKAGELRELIGRLLSDRAAAMESERKRKDQMQRITKLRESIAEKKAEVEKAKESSAALRERIVHRAGEVKTALDSMEEAEGRLKASSEGKVSDEEQLERVSLFLEARRLKLLSQIQRIYPIVEQEEGVFTIRGLLLPESDLAAHEEEQMSTALGYVCHLVFMLSKYLQVPLRYSLLHAASRSSVRDEVLGHSGYPLYWRGVERTKFDAAVTFLQRDVNQLLSHRGVPLLEGTRLLASLHRLMQHELMLSLAPELS